MTKEGDKLSFDLTGSSPQVGDYIDAALPCSRSCLFAALAATFTWDIPWNSELMELTQYVIPEGTFLNCRFPASCGLGTVSGSGLITAGASCIAKMLFSAGLYDYVNSSWGAFGGSVSSFGPGTWWGGHNQYGGVVGSGTYDVAAGGQGATPYRDGNDTGGSYPTARACISDVEWTEMYFPFLHFARKQGVDSGGYGKYRGGMNLESIQMVYGTKDLSTDFLPGPEGGEARGFGLFGGYPVGNILQDSILLLTSEEKIREKFSKGIYPVTRDELELWGTNARKNTEVSFKRQLGGIRINVPEYSVIVYSYGCGGGYGDPLDRDPIKVMEDVKNEGVTLHTAAKVYGVILNSKTFEVDMKKTGERRQEIRQERLTKRGKVGTWQADHKITALG